MWTGVPEADFMNAAAAITAAWGSLSPRPWISIMTRLSRCPGGSSNCPASVMRAESSSEESSRMVFCSLSMAFMSGMVPFCMPAIRVAISLRSMTGRAPLAAGSALAWPSSPLRDAAAALAWVAARWVVTAWMVSRKRVACCRTGSCVKCCHVRKAADPMKAASGSSRVLEDMRGL